MIKTQQGEDGKDPLWFQEAETLPYWTIYPKISDESAADLQTGTQYSNKGKINEKKQFCKMEWESLILNFLN